MSRPALHLLFGFGRLTRLHPGPKSHDTSRIVVSAGLHDLFLDLPIEQARDFVEKKRQILQSEP